jgi:hypothetical protein
MLTIPSTSLPATGDQIARLSETLRSRVSKTADGCWLWLGALTTRGYGKVTPPGNKGHTVYVHRIAYALRHGEIPAGLFVCHACDVPNCINPAHLFLGTARDNSLDQKQKGRSSKKRPRFSLETRSRCVAMRRAGARYREIAAAIGTSETNVARWLADAGMTRGSAPTVA